MVCLARAAIICVSRHYEPAERPRLASEPGVKTAATPPRPLQCCSDSEVISPTTMAGGNAGLVLCQVSGQYSGQ